MVNEKELRKLRERFELYSFGVAEAFVLDITHMSAEIAAMCILERGTKFSETLS